MTGEKYLLIVAKDLSNYMVSKLNYPENINISMIGDDEKPQAPWKPFSKAQCHNNLMTGVSRGKGVSL